MKFRLFLLTMLITSLPFSAAGQPSADVTGNWRGEKMGAPWVTVNIVRGQDGQLGGTAVFYILDRTETGQAPKVLGKQEVALVDPKMAGNVLSFKIKNQQGVVTMNPSSGEALAFTMVFRNKTEATLTSEAGEPLSVTMVRQK